MEKKKESSNLIITELFLVKADWTTTFLGEIRREVDSDGNPVVMGVVIINEGKVWSKASSQEELMRNMDDICLMKLNMELHAGAKVSFILFGEDFFLN